MLNLFDPDTGSPLSYREANLLCSAEGKLWPVIEGIPWLRTNREEMRLEATSLIEAGRIEDATLTLLRDQDDFCPTPPPSHEDVRAMLNDREATFRSSMEALAYGRVASYFAHRWSAPTYLSGLALMAMVAEPGVPLIEVACGTGQLIAEAAKRGFATYASDVVFSKCWLGKKFISSETSFICCDAVSGSPPLRIEGQGSVFCHDAFYFFPDKQASLDGMRLLADGGRVGIGHAHTDTDPTGIAGTPLPIADYKALSPGASFFSDDVLTDAIIGNHQPEEGAEEADAVSFVEGGAPLDALRFALPAAAALRRNPLLREREGTYGPHWPDEGFAAEYAGAGYLSGEGTLPADGALLSQHHHAARHRLLLDLPERW
ncbi:class I SAM-dependent methyltransferase [Parvularcula maris]|uniref:Class I SAM-dependent methyltransferase n=1 Tax=Parvularcula maris TaxID=2965077 RepID=A0A9X2L7Z6_9PROT|nr:class I SAM-dependent methyltransferase [Parvularcula maris]MCQ8184663.1 class I SAM-dependent methyltransferase [Parvularcula maris]